MKLPAARLHYASSEHDADLLYATGFMAPDPFLFVEVRGVRTITASDLELDRARATARECRVVPWMDFARQLEPRGQAPLADVIGLVLKKLKVKRALVPRQFPLGLARELGARGIDCVPADDPFWPERAIKRPFEVRAIEASLRAAEAGLLAGIEALRACTIGRDGYLRRDNRRFTADDLRTVVNQRILAEGCMPARTICAPGDEAVDPHEVGHGPIRANEPVVMDIFPRSEATGYFGDLTRTVVRGRASDKLKEIYALVHEGVKLGHSRVVPGAAGNDIHKAIQDLFEARGCRTGVKDGRMQGFFHGTGHGLGLEIHEAPSIGKRPDVLQEGHVVTVEPGLYYLGVGGVRIEDVALVTKSGSRNLTRVPKQLEIG
ncbi:MAG: Xaa-Pro peptidase family protein [Vicinamibacteria bacterium]|nr:Xaa-Pro peptidase family protein [Vicinamibacteria bacterium]